MSPFSRRPLLPLTMAYAAGTAVGSFFRAPPATPLLAGLVAVVVAVVAAARLPGPSRPETSRPKTSPLPVGVGGVDRSPRGRAATRRHFFLAAALLMAAFMAGAAAAGVAWARVGPGPADAGPVGVVMTRGLPGPGPARWVEVTGKVSSEPRATEHGESLQVRAGTAGPYWRRGEVLYVWCREESGAAPGDPVRVEGFLTRPRAPGNPGEFNFPVYLAARGIRYTVSAVTVSPAKGGSAMEPGPDGGAARTGPGERFARACRLARDALMGRAAASLPEEEGALFAGLVFGDTSRLPDDLVRDFRRSGVFHILAVSGSNVAFVAGGFWLLGRLLLSFAGVRGRRLDRVLLPATAVVLPAYAVMAAMDSSVIRATLMAEAGLVYLWLSRRRDVSGPLCLAALVMLASRPLSIVDPGVQLSYAATIGILVLYPPLWRAVAPIAGGAGPDDRGREGAGPGSRGPASAGPVRRFAGRLVRRAARATLQVGGVSLAAQAAVTPILAHHFGEVAVSGLVSNAVVVPCSGVAMTTGLAASLFDLAGVVGQPLAVPLYALTSILLKATIGCARLFAALPGASVITGAPSVPLILAYYLALAWITAGTTRRVGRPRLLRVLVVVAMAAVVSTAAAAVPRTARAEIVFLDVGQGDAAHLVLPGGRSLLVDGGPTGAGQRVVIPYLKHRGVSRLEAIFITHFHDDHVGGLAELLADPAIQVGELVLPPGARAGRLAAAAEAVLEMASRRGIPVTERGPGWRLAARDGVDLTVLAPLPQPAPPDGSTARRTGQEGAPAGVSLSSLENDGSLVLRLTLEGSGKVKAVAVLLTGDIETAGEASLLEAYGERLDSAILKVAHHGSAYGSGDGFLAAVSPAFAVTSVGANSFGHPSPRTEERLDRAGAMRLSTRDDGAITFRIKGGRITGWTFRGLRRLHWDSAAGSGYVGG